MHAELRWFVSYTLQRRSPQPGDRGRYLAKATQGEVTCQLLHQRSGDGSEDLLPS
jgi:hypothetical protein